MISPSHNACVFGIYYSGCRGSKEKNSRIIVIDFTSIEGSDSREGANVRMLGRQNESIQG